MDSKPTLCFTCGQSAERGQRLNHLDDGRICPTCARRLMEALPSLLPRQSAGSLEASEADEVGELGEAEQAAVDWSAHAQGREAPGRPDREGA